MKTFLIGCAVAACFASAAGQSFRGSNGQELQHWGTASVLLNADGEYELLWNVVDRAAVAYGNYSDMAAHPTSCVSMNEMK